MFRYNQTTLKKLEDLLRQAQYEVRYERGYFRSGYCLIRQKRVAVINQFLNTEARINALLEIISSLPMAEGVLSEEATVLLGKIKNLSVSR